MLFFKKKVKEDIEVSKKKFKLAYVFKILFIIMAVVGIYAIINIYNVFSKKSIKIYEVNTGEIVNVDRHKGFIVRDEDVATCKSSGYINFYAANASRVSRGSLIYTINDQESDLKNFDLDDKDIKSIKQNIKMYNNNITNLNFSNLYIYKENISNLIDEINVVKQLESIDLEKELNAKEKGYAKYAGLVSYIIDDYEDMKIEGFTSDLIKNFNYSKVDSQRKEVKINDKVYKLVVNPEFNILFDSDFDYDKFEKTKTIRVKFVYDNISTNGHIDSFIGIDNNKHFKLSIVDYPEKFLDRRIVEFEIENKKVNGYKIPIKSIVSKNCYVVPKNMLEIDPYSGENIFYKIGENGEKKSFTCNISKEDNKYYYISIDDSLSKLKFGDVLTNKYGDTYSLSEVVKLEGVYNMNKGYSVFKNIDTIDRTNEYAIIKKNTINGVSLYDHIALNASDINEGDLIS